MPNPIWGYGARLACIIVVTWWSLANSIAQSFVFQQYSEPQGIISSQSNFYAPGALAQTVNASPTSSGYGFAYWTINGQRVADPAGQSLTEASCVMTNDTVAIAWYLPISQDTNGNGIPDYIELFYYGSTLNAANSDTDGDGIIFLQELARGYDPAIPDTTINGGEIMRLSDLSTYVPPSNPQYYYTIESQPPGIIPTTSGYVPPGTPIQTGNIAYGATGGYYFGYWKINGVRQADAAGVALTRISLPMTNDETAVAVFFPPGDSTGSGLQDWYQWFWFGDTNQIVISDPTGDGFTIGDDLARGYSPVVTNITVNGGEIMRMSDMATYAPTTNQQYYYVIESQPVGIFPTSSGYVSPGTPIQTGNIVYGATSGYDFGYWTINGVRQVDAAGAALTEITLPMTNDETAVAVFVPSGDSTGGGLQDWYQWFWFGNLNQTTNSDPTGDGFTIGDDLARDYSPVVTNNTVNGGEIMRLSDLTTYVPPTNKLYYYLIESQPTAIIPTTSGYVAPGTPVRTLNISYGATSGYYFGYWTINGVRQADAAGAALTEITLPMTNDETAVAVFFLPGDSTGSGLQDWYQWFWFGNTNQTTNSDPTGDGFTIGDDLARDYSPVVTNAAVNGGEVMRLSDFSVYIPPAAPSPPVFITISIVNGQIVLSWTGGGVLQSATSLSGPWAPVPGATSPYTITNTSGQSFYRVQFQ